jgi:superfamily II DNA or RNA helicase
MNENILKNRIEVLKNKKALDENEKTYLSKLENGDIKNTDTPYSGIINQMNQLTVDGLRRCQKECLAVMEEKFNNQVMRSYYKLACGSGKTKIIITFIKNHPKQRHLILVPSLLLMYQFAEAMNDMEISMCGTGQIYDPLATVCICVYNSINKIKKNYDCMFIDEAHHVYVPEIYREKEETNITTGYIKDIQDYKTMKFYFSATIDDYHYQFTFSEAINEGYLTNFNMEFFETEVLKKEDLYEIIYNHPEYQHVIVYCNNIKNCKMLSTYLNSQNMSSDVISAEIPQSARKDIIDKFKVSDLRVIFTVQCLSEGVNITCADTCIFYDKRNSVVNVIQCIGRVLRYDPTKFIGHVVVIVTPNNYDKLFKTLLKILSTQFDLSDLKNINPNSYSLTSHEFIDRKFAFDTLLEQFQIYNTRNLLVKGQLQSEYETLLKTLPSFLTEGQIINISKNIKFFNNNDIIENEFHKKIFEENIVERKESPIVQLMKKDITLSEIKTISDKYKIYIIVYDEYGKKIDEHANSFPIYPFIFFNNQLYLQVNATNSSTCKECKRLISIPNIDQCKLCQKKDDTFIWNKLECTYIKTKSICQKCGKLIKHPSAIQCKSCQTPINIELYSWNQERYVYIQKFNKCDKCETLIPIEKTRCFTCFDGGKTSIYCISSINGYNDYMFLMAKNPIIIEIDHILITKKMRKLKTLNFIDLTFDIQLNDIQIEFINHLLQKYFPSTTKIKNKFIIKHFNGKPTVEQQKQLIEKNRIKLKLKPIITCYPDKKTYLQFQII